LLKNVVIDFERLRDLVSEAEKELDEFQRDEFLDASEVFPKISELLDYLEDILEVE